MKNSMQIRKGLSTLKLITGGLMAVCTLLILLSLTWSITHERQKTRVLVQNSARIHFNKDIALRQWVTRHGGIYVIADNRTPPNPYLNHVPGRDVTTLKGVHLTLMNPAYMLRQVMNENPEAYGISSHITGLEPRNPINIPDKWEKNAIMTFKRGNKESVEFTYINKKPFLRLMRPIIVQERCIKCHERQGYKIGDIKGGVSIAMPIASYLALEKKSVLILLLTHAVILVLGLTGIWFAATHSRRWFIGQKMAEEALKRNHDRLEELVAERTAEIIDTNKRLRREITERKNMEVTLRKTRETAEAASLAKSIFLANMSHELRTPLNAILGFSQLLEREPDFPPAQRKSIGIINRSGEYLLSLINDVLDMSKIEAGHVELEISSFNFHDMLFDIEDMIRVRVGKKNLQFIIERARDLPRHIQADKNKLRQVLINLLGNAVKFTDKGSIVLRVGTEMGKEETFPSRLMFEIEDSGVGISLQDTDRIFEPFSRIDGDRQERKGTGLGLAISRQFVRLMGGEITIQNEVGVGSVFTFYIEIEASDVTKNGKSKRRSRVVGLEPEQPVPRILVVEDNEPNRILLIDLLESIGFDTREALNGKDALEQCISFRPHLIWMDIQMPVMDGYEATRRIKAGKYPETKIIALTAHAFEENRKQILAAGCDDFIRKPFKEYEIFEAMGKHLGVCYIYEEEEVSWSANRTEADTIYDLSSDTLAMLNSELQTELKQAVIMGRQNQIANVMKKIRIDDPALADMLEKLIDEFEYEKILSLIQGEVE